MNLTQSREPRACPLPVTSLQPVVQPSQPMLQHIGEGTLDHKILTGPPNASWVTNSENQQPLSVLTGSQVNTDLKQLSSLLDFGQQWALQQDQHSVHFPSHQLPLTTDESYVSNGHAALPSNVELSHTGYSITPALHEGAAVLNGVSSPDLCDHQSYQLQQTPVPAPCVSQCPTQSSTLELEQLFGLSQPQHSLPPYGVVGGSPADSIHRKVKRADDH